jgi:hypothetical protein
MASPPPRLLGQVGYALRLKHCACRTEQAYLRWFRRFIRFHQLRHPANVGKPEIEGFFAHLAVQKNVASSTHTIPPSLREGSRPRGAPPKGAKRGAGQHDTPLAQATLLKGGDPDR